MIAIDVGAHIGYYSRLLSHLVGPDGRVLAFEPCPEYYAVLLHNLRRRRYRNVEVFDLAVSDRPGTVPLYLSPGSSNHSLMAGYTENPGVVEVKSVVLEAFLSARRVDRVEFVKIDVEGAEPLVLAGMRELISRSPEPVVLLELNPPALRAGNVYPGDLLGLLEGMGFDVQEIGSDGTLAPVALDGTGETRNLLCRKILPRWRTA